MDYLFKPSVKLLFFIFSIALWQPAQGQAQVPEIGAQVWVEPSMSNEQIDQVFAQMEQHGMKTCRLFVMWNYIEKQPNQWDWRIYDAAFASAKQHHIKVCPTLMATTSVPAHRDEVYHHIIQAGGIWKNSQQKDQSQVYIQKLVQRYKDHKQLHSWILHNEPGQFPEDAPLAIDRFRIWLKDHYPAIDSLNKSWMTAYSDYSTIRYEKEWAKVQGFKAPQAALDWRAFWADHHAWYLSETARMLRQYDKKTPLHANPHALMDLLVMYDFPKWMKTLQSLGSSIHPVWHLNDVSPNNFIRGVSWCNDLINGMAGDKPHWVTELQGGMNTYSAEIPYQPSAMDVASWVWTSIAAGSEKIIFWSMNHRYLGTEAGEWGLLNWKLEPSEDGRLAEVKIITQILDQRKNLFKAIEPYTSSVTIALSQTTLRQHSLRSKERTFDPIEQFRGWKAHLYEAFAWYGAIQGAGVSPDIRYINQLEPKEGQVIIVPHAEALSKEEREQLKARAAAGAKLIFSGMNGTFNEQYQMKPRLIIPDLQGLEVRHNIFIEDYKATTATKKQWREFSAETEVKYSEGAKLYPYYQNDFGKGQVLTLPMLLFLMDEHESVFDDCYFLNEFLREHLQNTPALNTSYLSVHDFPQYDFLKRAKLADGSYLNVLKIINEQVIKDEYGQEYLPKLFKHLQHQETLYSLSDYNDTGVLYTFVVFKSLR